MLKRQRQQEIVKLVRTRQIHTQEQLAEELHAIGIDTTQVTLSRDIRELGLAKTHQGYRELQAAPPPADVLEIVAEFVVEVKAAQNLVVLRTTPGSASPVAVALDNSGWPEIVGTIAGDDTVLIIAPDQPTAEQLKGRLTG